MRDPCRRSAAGVDADPLREPASGRRRRSARRARSRDQRQRDLRRDLRGRLGSCRARRSAGCGNPGPRSDVPAQVHDLLPDRGYCRRNDEHHGAVPGVPAPWGRGCRGQVLRAELRRVRNLYSDDRRPRCAPAGPVRPSALTMGKGDPMASHTVDTIAAALHRKGRWNVGEILFWVAAVASLFLLPERHLILNEIAIIGLFAVSLDLILGYAGIVSLGHAAFFGLGAYVAGLTAKYIVGEPLLGLLAAAACAAVLGFLTSFLVLRGADLTRLMVTLGVALVMGEIANQASWLTGGADGLQGVTFAPILGLFEFDIFGTTAYAYSLAVLFILFVMARRLVVSPFGL